MSRAKTIRFAIRCAQTILPTKSVDLLAESPYIKRHFTSEKFSRKRFDAESDSSSGFHGFAFNSSHMVANEQH